MGLASSLAFGPAMASPITVSFTGTITDDPYGLTVFGAPISGTYTFDASAVDAIAAASTGSYTSSGPPYGFTANIDGTVYQVAGTSTINTANDIGVDQYGVVAILGDLTLELLLQDATQTALSSDALPTTLPALAAFDFAQFHLFSDDAEFTGTLTSLVCIDGCTSAPTGPTNPPTSDVPEPSTLPLLVAGAFIWIENRRRRSAPASA